MMVVDCPGSPWLTLLLFCYSTPTWVGLGGSGDPLVVVKTVFGPTDGLHTPRREFTKNPGIDGSVRTCRPSGRTHSLPTGLRYDDASLTFTMLHQDCSFHRWRSRSQWLVVFTPFPTSLVGGLPAHVQDERGLQLWHSLRPQGGLTGLPHKECEDPDYGRDGPLRRVWSSINCGRYWRHRKGTRSSTPGRPRAPVEDSTSLRITEDGRRVVPVPLPTLFLIIWNPEIFFFINEEERYRVDHLLSFLPATVVNRKNLARRKKSVFFTYVIILRS